MPQVIKNYFRYTLQEKQSNNKLKLKILFSIAVSAAYHQLCSLFVLGLFLCGKPAALVQVDNLTKFKSMLRTVDFSFALLGKF